MRDTNYAWSVEMQIKAIQRGLRSAKVPVGYRTRMARSKVSGTLKGVIFAGGKILFTIFVSAFDDFRERSI